MIAPIRQSPAQNPPSTSLSSARRSVATVLFRRPADESAAPSVSRLTALVFLAWLLAVATSYFVAGWWWSVRRP